MNGLCEKKISTGASSFVFVPLKGREGLHNVSSLAAFDKRYYGNYPSSTEEIDHMIDVLAGLIRKAYDGMNVEITDFRIYHANPYKDGNAYSYKISWYLQKDSDADDTQRVHCVVRRLSPTCESYYRTGDAFIYTASAHTTKRVGRGLALANDKSIFHNNAADIVDISLELLNGLSA